MGSGPPNGFFGEGVQESVPGKLFGESTARGARQPESWETSWYLGMGLAAAFLYVGLQARPNTNIMDWAREEAQRRRESAQ